MSALRLILASSLLAATLVAVTPPAAACTLDLGPADTLVCVTDHNHAFGDHTCEDEGYRYGSTFGFVDAAGIAYASAAGDQSCLNNGSSQRESHQIRTSAALWGVAALHVRYTDSQESSGDFCEVGVDASTNGAGEHHHDAPCVGGVVPAPPWGDLLPW